MKIPGTLCVATHEQLDDVGCYCYVKQKIDKNGFNLTPDPYVPVGAIMMYIKSVSHNNPYYGKVNYDVYLYKDKFIEFDPEDEVVIPLDIEEP